MKHWYNPITTTLLHDLESPTDLSQFVITHEALSTVGEFKEPWCLECVVTKGKASKDVYINKTKH